MKEKIFSHVGLPVHIGNMGWGVDPEKEPDKVSIHSTDIAHRVDKIFGVGEILWYRDYEDVTDRQLLEILEHILNRYGLQRRQKHIGVNAWFFSVEKVTIQRLHKYLETPEGSYRLQAILLRVFFSQRGMVLEDIEKEQRENLIENFRKGKSVYLPITLLITNIIGNYGIDLSDLEDFQADGYINILKGIVNDD